MTEPRLIASGPDTPDYLAAEAVVRRFCGWHVAPVIESVAVITDPGPVIFLPTLQLVDVVISRGGATIEPASYRTSVHGWIDLSWGLTAWPEARTAPLEITYTHGYEIAPADIEVVVRTLADAGAQAVDRYEAQALMPHRLPRAK